MTPCLQSTDKLSNAVSGLGCIALSVCLSPATSKLVGVSRGCHRAPRCELAPRWSVKVVREGRGDMRVAGGQLSLLALLYWCAVLRPGRGRGLSPRLQGTSLLSETIAGLGACVSPGRPGQAELGPRCGQTWWSASRATCPGYLVARWCELVKGVDRWKTHLSLIIPQGDMM